MINYKTVKVIDCSDWDNLVEQTYGRTYNFQQQDGCKDRGTHNITIPAPYEEDEEYPEDYYPIPVKFKDWLARDPKEITSEIDPPTDWMLKMWWERDFYPDVQAVANDLHAKGLIESGEYIIKIDW